LLEALKYVSVKIIQPYSVFHALSNGIGFTLSERSQKFGSVDMYLQTFLWRNSCLILDSQTINQFISSRTKCHSPCFKMVKKSGRYLLLFESNKEFKIGSYFSITLYLKWKNWSHSYRKIMYNDDRGQKRLSECVSCSCSRKQNTKEKCERHSFLSLIYRRDHWCINHHFFLTKKK
jgi:hypothetical protein